MTGMFHDLWQFVLDPSNTFAKHSTDYILICVEAIVMTTIISIALAIIVARSPILAFIAVNFSGLLRAIPIIAFLSVSATIPFLGLGYRPALIALVVLGIPPILINTYTGIRGIDPAMIDAARGMGMTSRQIVTRIQAPLLLPVIAAGVRTSAVQIIATATLAAIVGAGGYGEYIYLGLREFDNTQLLAGAVPVIILALAVEILMAWIQRLLTPAGLRTQRATEVART